MKYLLLVYSRQSVTKLKNFSRTLEFKENKIVILRQKIKIRTKYNNRLCTAAEMISELENNWKFLDRSIERKKAYLGNTEEIIRDKLKIFDVCVITVPKEERRAREGERDNVQEFSKMD